MGIDHWIDGGFGGEDRRRYDEGLSWRSSQPRDDPNRVTAVLTLHCASPNCQRPGVEIVELHYADGRRSYSCAVREVLGEGTYHWPCPSLRDEDLQREVDDWHDHPRDK